MSVNTCLWSELEHKLWPGQGCSKKFKRLIIACELWVERVSAFGVVLYRNQWPVNFNLHFGELHSDNSLKYKLTLFEN